MSSLPRRIQKRIAKSMGYIRDPKSGDILDSQGESVGKYWPKVSAIRNPKAPGPKVHASASVKNKENI